MRALRRARLRLRRQFPRRCPGLGTGAARGAGGGERGVRRAAARSRHGRARVRAAAGRPASLGCVRCVCTSGSKNLLVFLPLLASHRFLELPLLVRSAAGLLRLRPVRLVGLRAQRPDGPRERPPSTRASGPRASRPARLSPGAGLSCGLLSRRRVRVGLAVGAAFAAWLGVYLGADAALHLPAQAQDPGRRPGAGGAVYLAHHRGRRGCRHVARLLAARVLAVPVPEPGLRQALLRTRGHAARRADRARRAATTSSPTCR